MEEIAYAKINLALHVRERMADGYHRIETLFAFAEDGDRLTAEPADALSLAIEGPFAAALSPDEDNLVTKAARLVSAESGVRCGARLVLEKNLPVASGLGGGSADAAATIHLLTRFWGVACQPRLRELSARLGADVPACILSRTCRGEGRGDRLSLVGDAGVEGLALLLVNPRIALPTSDVFRAWDGVDRGPLGDWHEGRNDLEAPALRLVPEIGEVLQALRLREPLVARMSGSGATCFALFEDAAKRDAASAAIAAERPHWWQLSSRLR